MAKEKLGLLFLGRLESEKGFDLIIDLIKQYAGAELPFELYIFGAGSYETQLLELAAQHPEIHFFGWKPLSEVERYLQNIDYCLMPSRFLETFGLSAINVLKRGIPVLGFKKGGLIPFIPEKFALEQQTGKDELAQLKHLLQQLQQEKKEKNADFFAQLATESKEIAQHYSIARWLEQFEQMTQGIKGKKLVIMSDFINKVGGIETYIHDVKHILEAQGWEVKLFGSTCPKGIWGNIKKYFGLGLAVFNLPTAIKRKKFLQKEQPDLIRYHSMIRRMGRMPLAMSKHIPAKKWMMYHDFGYFYPYPHQLGDPKKVQTPLSLKNYLSMAETHNPIKKLLIIGKYCSLTLLHRQLKNQIDLHLVPSDFMVPIVTESFGLEKEKVQDFNHFMQG